MKQFIGKLALVVRDYDEAIGFYVGKLGFSLAEDTYIPEHVPPVVDRLGGGRAGLAAGRVAERVVDLTRYLAQNLVAQASPR